MDGGFGTNARKSVIKSIQRGTITVSAISATGTATISAVDTDKAKLTLLGYSIDANGSGVGNDVVSCRIALTNSTTVTATRFTTSTPIVTVSFEVVEYF